MTGAPLNALLAVSMALFLGGCAGSRQSLATVDYVDLERFMGDWYVIAHIPTFLEDEAYNAVESYALEDDGSIATTFTFREGGFDGEKKRYEPRGFVVEGTGNAIWGMRFVWPIKADYRIIYLDDGYDTTIIGREKRDYVWLMARTPQIDASKYQRAVNRIEAAGYDLSGLRKVPQQW
ncbi:MAG: lipocalin family protein [Xanthomonadales bacterium]|nr:lipocalin family protein [Xanthomonadales bacterium]